MTEYRLGGSQPVFFKELSELALCPPQRKPAGYPTHDPLIHASSLAIPCAIPSIQTSTSFYRTLVTTF